MRRISPLCLSFFIFFALFPRLRAQQLPPSNQQPAQSPPSAPVRDAQAIALLNNAFATMGGENAAAIQDTLVQATITSHGNEGSESGGVIIKTKGPYMIRIDSTESGATTGHIFNKGREFQRSDKGWREPPSANASHKRIDHLPPLLLAHELARTDFSATYVGQEPIDGRTTNHVRLARVSNFGNGADKILTRNSQVDVWLDTQTSTITKISYPYIAENDMRISVPMEITYDDYRAVNGLLVPFHQKCFLNGQYVSEMQFKSFDINLGRTDSEFEEN
jgi:hypothetical protein